MADSLQTILAPVIPDNNQQTQYWGQLYGNSLALALVETAKKSQQPVIVITGSVSEAHLLESAIEFFTPNNIPLLHFPDWETLPYDLFSPHQDIISERLRTLFRLPQITCGVVVVPVTTLMHRLPPVEFISQRAFDYHTGDHLNLNDLREKLEHSGYRCVDTVIEHGEFTVRGSLVDIYPMGAKLPFRIDLFDNEIETLRTFDPETQRTLTQTDNICLLPAREVPLDKSAIRRFKDNWLTHFDVDHRRCPLYQDVSEGITSQGIEYFLPLFSLTSYVSSITVSINVHSAIHIIFELSVIGLFFLSISAITLITPSFLYLFIVLYN